MDNLRLCYLVEEWFNEHHGGSGWIFTHHCKDLSGYLYCGLHLQKSGHHFKSIWISNDIAFLGSNSALPADPSFFNKLDWWIANPSLFWVD